MHPADWKRLSQDERTYAIYSGAFDGIDWRVERVAHLVGLDAERLDCHVGGECGWEAHDIGYLAAVIRSARILLACPECEGAGVTVQGWTDKNGYSEDQYGDCAACGPNARGKR